MKERKKLRAAMAAADITPEEDVYLEGYEEHGELSLARYPQDQTSDLKARILVLEYGSDRLVLINLELLFADVKFQYGTLSETFPGKAAAVCGTTPDRILLSNTHTHHAPRRLGAAQEERILQALQIACGRLRPAVIRAGSSHTAYGVSRSRDYSIDYTRPYDDELTVLRVDEEDGAPIGLVFNVPIHNTLYGHGPDLKKNRHLLNCEFTGYASRHLESLFAQKNPGFTAMHVNGFYGNSGPVFRGEYYAPTLDDLKQAGADFGEEILDCWERADRELQMGPSATAFLEGTLDTRQDDRHFAPSFGDYAREPVLIHAGALGDLATVAVNYEPFSILGARLKAESPFPVLLPAAGMGWRGYIPTKETWQMHRLQREVECQPIKTPLTEAAEENFYQMLLQTVCDLRDVTPCRIPAVRDGMIAGNQTAVYRFHFSIPFRADKLILDFGQYARTDCASYFILTAGGNGNEERWEVSDFSSAYGGFFTRLPKVEWISLQVKERYMYGRSGIDRLSPAVYGIRYVRKENHDEN